MQQNSIGSQWSCLRIGDAHVYVTVCANPSKCVLDTLQFAHVETGQTPKERVAVMKETTHQSSSHQDSSFICQILSNSPKITHLNEARLTNISKGEISIKPDTKFLYKC